MNPALDWARLNEQALELIAPLIDLWGDELKCVWQVRVWGKSVEAAAAELELTPEQVQEYLDSAWAKACAYQPPKGEWAGINELLQCMTGPPRHNPSTPLMAGDKYREGQENNAREVVLRDRIVSPDDFVGGGDWRGGVPPRHPLNDPRVVPGEGWDDEDRERCPVVRRSKR